MKRTRWFEIIYILLTKDRVAARELAEHFEVSTKTIYRDVSELSASGIPIYMTQGNHGGISLLSGYVLNKAVLTEQEKSKVLSALFSLKAMDGAPAEALLAKLSAFLGAEPAPYYEIDFNDWGNVWKESFEKAKEAIEARKCLAFDYVSVGGACSRRTVEPTILWFKEKNWYLKAYCRERQAMRCFRFSRMRAVKVLDEVITQSRGEQAPTLSLKEKNPTQPIHLLLRLEAPMEYRVLDEFSPQDVVQNADKSFTVRWRVIEDEWLYGYLLSFGPWATMLSPVAVRKTLQERLQKTLERYEKESFSNFK